MCAPMAGPATAAKARMVALIGDAEMDEGQYLRNPAGRLEARPRPICGGWSITIASRLDAVIREGLWELREPLRNFGWDVVIVKYGTLQQAAFAEPGGARLKAWIDACPTNCSAPSPFPGRRGLAQTPARRHRRSGRTTADRTAQRRRAAGGADDQSRRPRSARLLEAFEKIDPRPPGLLHRLHGQGQRACPSQGHKDNHAGLMTPSQMDGLREGDERPPGHEWEPFEGL